jgi:hypothetical protein
MSTTCFQEETSGKVRLKIVSAPFNILLTRELLPEEARKQQLLSHSH